MIRLTGVEFENYTNGFADGYKTKEKELEKYRWHDLRKNPEDLPEDDVKLVLVALEEHYTEKVFYETFTPWFMKSMMREQNNQYIAWRYIEPFEDDNA